MNVLIVVESAFGTTATIADALAAGLRSSGATVTVVPAADAPSSAGFDLVFVGAPTHNLGLPTPKSRALAAQRGGAVVESGVAEWLVAQSRLGGVRAAAFDTVVPGPFSGSAAKKIERALKRLGADVVARESFLVHGTPAMLADGEVARAGHWAAGLVPA